MWEQVALLALGALLVKFLEPWVDRVKARTAAEYWETQERWRFKADLYSRALVALRRLRQPLEVGAFHGQWPEGHEWQRAVGAARELDDAASIAAIWLPEEALKPLVGQGERLLTFRKLRHLEKQQLLALCASIQGDVDELMATAKRDLRLHFVQSRRPWWMRLGAGPKGALNVGSPPGTPPEQATVNERGEPLGTEEDRRGCSD